MDPLWALALAAAVAAVAALLQSLSPSGALAATAVGAAILIGTGWGGAAVLLAFFGTSSILGRLADKPPGAIESKGERRDVAQVLANGGAAAIGALLALAVPSLGIWLVTIPLAGATADTWGTAIGTAWGGEPVDLASGRRVPPGSSGAVTTVGSLAGLAGAGVIGWLGGWAASDWSLAAVALVLGFGTMMLDSWLGSRLQARFECPECSLAGEDARCRCGARARHTRGIEWLRNDAVNFISTTAAALAGLGLWLLLCC